MEPTAARDEAEAAITDTRNASLLSASLKAEKQKKLWKKDTIGPQVSNSQAKSTWRVKATQPSLELAVGRRIASGQQACGSRLK